MSALDFEKAFYLIRVGSDAQHKQEKVIRAEFAALYVQLAAAQKLLNEASIEIDRGGKLYKKIHKFFSANERRIHG